MLAFASAPTDTTGPLTHLLPYYPRPTHDSLADNGLCGVDEEGDGDYTTEGITALCKGIKGSALTSLECAAVPKCSLLCQRPPVDTRLLSHCPHPSPIPCSLAENFIGAKGASALAAILKHTKITNLECAAAPSVRSHVSAP